MRSTVSEKFLTNIYITLIARATILALPFVVSFTTWLMWQVYTHVEDSLTSQQEAISEIKEKLQDHEFRLTAGQAQRAEFQSNVLTQFQKFDEALLHITDKVTETNNAVIRVQTIVETRLPPKSTERIK